jgi:hypothetical protein
MSAAMRTVIIIAGLMLLVPGDIARWARIVEVSGFLLAACAFAFEYVGRKALKAPSAA